MHERLKLSKQLRQVLLLAWKDNLVRFQQRVTLMFIVVLPLLLTLIMGLAFKGFEPSSAVATIALVDEDHGPIADRFRRTIPSLDEYPAESAAGEEADSSQPNLRAVFQTDLSPDEARRRIRAGEIDGALLLPEGLSQRLSSGQPAKIEVLVGPAESPPRAMVEAAADRLVQRVRQQNPLPLEWTAVVEADQSRLVEGFNSFSQAVAGNGVMFILLNCMATGGLALVQERRQNTLSRLLISPLTPSTIIFGKTLGVFFVGLAQAIVVFGFGVLVGVTLGSAPGVVSVTLLFILVGSSLGLTVAALAEREETVQAVCAPIALVMTALGGGMFPLEMSPPWMKSVALLFPTGWAMDAYHQLMWDGRDWTSVLPHLGVLAGFSALFFAVGIRSLRWDQ